MEHGKAVLNESWHGKAVNEYHFYLVAWKAAKWTKSGGNTRLTSRHSNGANNRLIPSTSTDDRAVESNPERIGAMQGCQRIPCRPCSLESCKMDEIWWKYSADTSRHSNGANNRLIPSTSTDDRAVESNPERIGAMQGCQRIPCRPCSLESCKMDEIWWESLPIGRYFRY